MTDTLSVLSYTTSFCIIIKMLFLQKVCIASSILFYAFGRPLYEVKSQFSIFQHNPNSKNASKCGNREGTLKVVNMVVGARR